ncbi:LIC10906 family membrane protein [Leptospira stimsonii]|uniref:Histidine kinase N-terminal 7TM region domain-containing protein n=1 Tax=Leptospira stimsonii TaxID=2202203 RepID=A0A396YNJ7_9LEPT|nr:histidine kinase N-terminal 7TM domain-containing protein [Leptospira stimsonii]RHX84739.1 hypothetical protein DLM75_22250 [Leptospira stimsonii]
MNLNILFPILAGVLHILFGVYVFKLKPKQKAPTIFLILSLFLSSWMIIQAFRVFLPIEFRNIALNLTFLPISYATFTLYALSSIIENPDKRLPIWSYFLGFFGLAYVTIVCLTQNMATLKDHNNFIFDLNLNYHLLVIYLVFWMILSICAIIRKMLISRGDFKVRLFLVLLGAILALPLTTIFVYFLPLFGIYKPYLSSIGLIIASLFWAVAILHYDAFQIKSKVIRGEDLPIINKMASSWFLRVLEKLDPIRYVQKSSKQKEEITKEILIQDYNLATGAGELSVEKRAQILSKKFGKYFK